MCIKKKYLSNNEFCKVTFILPDRLVPETKSVHIAGDFNDWSMTSTEMRKVSGKYIKSMKLKANKAYQFRYLINGKKWENDLEADGIIPPERNYYNSIINL
jgi:1,4-alpha-glucan branching enzyme